MTLFELETTFSTPVGSGIFTVVAVLAIFSLVLALLRHYLPLRSTPAYVTLPVFLALALPASAILLVPIDLASSPPDSATPSGIWLSKRVMLVSWRIVYWLTFVLTWVILPFLGEYLDSGYRTPKARILYSIRSNGRYQLVVLGSGVIGLIYITVQNGLDFTSLRSLVMALAYVWGLVMAIYLMGHGLVALPRRLWLNVNTGDKLKRIQSRAPQIHERLTDSVTNLEDVCFQVKQLQRRKPGVAPFLQDWIDELSEIAQFSASRLPQSGGSDGSVSHVPSVITERYLANLTRTLHRTRHQNARFMSAWDRLVREASDCQAIINSYASKHLEFGPNSMHSSILYRLPFITPYIRYHIFVHILPATRAVFAGIFSLASVCVVWSELIKTFAVSLSVIGISVTKVHSNSGQVGFFGQVIASGWILYMCSAAFVGVNDAKVWGNRALVPRNTYGESACWYAGLIARLTVPLAYNFVTFLPKEVQRKTTFYEFLGRLISLTPLGKGFDYFFPIFILFPVCATKFNLYGKIQTTFGLAESVDDDDLEGNPGGFGSGGWREGQALIDQELSGPGFLGLSSRSAVNSNAALGSSHIRVPRSAPTLWVPPAQSSSGNDQDSSRLRRTKNSTSQRPPEEEEEEEENFFQSFAHRVRNTIDTTSKPKWLQDVDAGFKRPRWMGGPADDEDEPPRPDRAGGVGRLFGGQPGDGRLRL